jgi:putative ABC transport system ATP-binding protein
MEQPALQNTGLNTHGAATDELIVEARGLTKSYGKGLAATRVLRGTDLLIRRGEFVAVMGPSGCGKSTLLHIVGLMDRADDGTLVIDGEDVTTASQGQRTRLRRDRMGFVFQRFNLLSTVSAADNLAISLHLHGRPADSGHIAQCLERMGVSHVAARKSGQMSIGEQQRVAMARALAHQPELLLADEPTGSLDTANADSLLALLAQMNAAGQTIVMITHSPAAAAVAHRVCRMQDGRITCG